MNSVSSPSVPKYVASQKTIERQGRNKGPKLDEGSKSRCSIRRALHRVLKQTRHLKGEIVVTTLRSVERGGDKEEGRNGIYA